MNTVIYYPLERETKIAWHILKDAYKIWIYIRGYPLNLQYLYNDVKLIRNFILVLITWKKQFQLGIGKQKSTGEFTLLICCVGTGFDFNDFELLINTNHTSRLDKVINDLI